MNTEDSKISRRCFLKASGAAAGFALLGGGLKGFIPGPRAASGQDIPTIEGLTKGQIKVGSTITKENVELVKGLLSSGNYEKVKRGMQVPIVATRTNPEELVPSRWLEITEKSRGQAVLDKNGQLWAKDGKPWTGGFPFPEPKTGLELIWDHSADGSAMTADDWQYPTSKGYLIRRGEVYRTFDLFYRGIRMTGRINKDPKPNYPGHEDELYRLIISYQKPFDFKGAGFLTIRPYDQSKLETIYGYFPALRRVLRLSTKQRWESPVGDDFFNSDYQMHNDPILSWEWKILEKKPMLLPHVLSKYPKTLSIDAGRFARSEWELRPEVFVLHGVPKDTASPYGHKILYMDSVMLKPTTADYFDRQGRLWKTALFFFSWFEAKGKRTVATAYLNQMDIPADHVTYYSPETPQWDTGARVDEWWTEKAMLQASI